jgi:hypothetical protein
MEGVLMTQKIFNRVVKGTLPMQFSRREDLSDLQGLRNAGYLKVTFAPLRQNQRFFATVTEVTTLGRAAMRYLGYGFRSHH